MKVNKMFYKIILIIIVVLFIPFTAISTVGLLSFEEAKSKLLNDNTEVYKSDTENSLLEFTKNRALYYETFLYSFYNLTNSYKNFIEDVFEFPDRYGNVTTYSNDENLTELGVDPNYVSSYHLPSGIVMNDTIQEIINKVANMDLIWTATAKDNPYIAWAYFGSKFGVYQLYRHYDIDSDYDPRVRPWYIKATNNNPNNEVIITEPYIDAFGKGLMVTFAVPVYYNNNTEFLGVIAIDVTINTIVETIFKPLLQNSGYQFLVNKSGGVIARINLNETENNMDSRWDETHKTENLLDTSNEQFNKLMLNNVITGESGISTIEFQEGGIKYIAYEPIPIVSWSFVVVVSESEVIENVLLNTLSINSAFDRFVFVFSLIFIVSMTISILIGYIYSRNLTKPLIALSNASDKISVGNYDINLDVKGEDELAKLSIAFLSMNKSLKSSRYTLRNQKEILILLLEAKGLSSRGDIEDAKISLKKSLEISNEYKYPLLTSIARTELNLLKSISDIEEFDEMSSKSFDSDSLNSYISSIAQAINELDKHE